MTDFIQELKKLNQENETADAIIELIQTTDED